MEILLQISFDAKLGRGWGKGMKKQIKNLFILYNCSSYAVLPCPILYVYLGTTFYISIKNVIEDAFGIC